MIIETDLLYAFVKESDWLKPVASRFLLEVSEGKHGVAHASRESLHELYYVSMSEGVSLDDYIIRAAAVTAIDNLVFHPTTHEVDLLAFVLMKQYGISSVFDAYHAATALNMEEDHTIVSTDTVFDKVPGLIRLDPRDMK